MRPALRSLLITAALAGAAVTHADEPMPKIQQDALLERMEQKDASMIILDVRTPEEFAAGHVPGAVNIPYTHLPARLSELQDAGDKDIVLYCATGIRAERAAERKLLPLAAERGVAVIVNRPFAEGGLFRSLRGKPLPPWASEIGCTSWAQLLLKFIVAHPAVTCAIPATSTWLTAFVSCPAPTPPMCLIRAA